MTVTERLLSLHRVDQQLRGLESRLRAAERFLAEQQTLLERLESRHAALASQLRQIEASIAERESETRALDERMDRLRERMNAARTNKEYKALLTELNTLKADRGHIDEDALELMAKADELRAQLAQVDQERDDRARIRARAQEDRDRKSDEIRQRVDELRAERESLARQVPADALRLYEELLTTLGDQAMAPVEEQDRRRQEYTCGACMMSLPIELVSASISGTTVSRCASCGCILYIDRELAGELQSAAAKR